MFKHNILYKSLFAVSMVACAVAVNAETVSGNAGVTVSNAFDLTKVADLNFGTIRATQIISGGSIGTTAGIKVLADGSGSEVLQAVSVTGADAVSEADIIVPGTPAEFLIENAAANSEMELVLTGATAIPIYEIGDAGGTEVFTLNITPSDVRVVSGGVETQFNGSNLQTDATGTVGMKVGGSLRIAAAQDGTMDDTSYIGTFDITVNY